ncbi:MAG: choice-of-anchor J domain-containing protein [Chitinophagaceae bacterium]
MNTLFFKRTLFYALTAVVLLQSCDDKDDVIEPPLVVSGQSFTQSFETLAEAQTQGWVFKNRSDDPATGWVVRSNVRFSGVAPFDGTRVLYSNYLASNGVDGNISDWAISPKRIFQNGDKISFYTISSGTTDGYGDRLQLRLNIFNTSDSIGTESTDIGNFTKPLIDINPLYKIAGPGDYPTTWTKYEATIAGLNKPDSGRFAIRYFVEIHGGANADELAIDKVEFKSATP